MTHQDKERELQDYLEGKSELSRTYRQLPEPQPPARVDEAILAASRKAVKARPRFAFSPFASDWHERAALAAVVVLCVVLIITMQQETQVMEPSLLHPEPPAVLSDEIATDRAAAEMEMKRQVLKKEAPAERAEEAATERTEDEAMMSQPAADDTFLPAKKIPVMRELPAGEVSSGSDAVPQAAAGIMEQQVAPAAAESPRLSVPLTIEKDTRQPDQPLLNEEAVSAILSDEETRLETINQLWEAGQKEQAQRELKAFLRRYPEYRPEALRQRLDPVLVEAVLSDMD